MPFLFHSYSKYDSHLFFKILFTRKGADVKIDIITRPNEEHTSVTYGCIRFIDSNRVLTNKLGNLTNWYTEIIYESIKNLKQQFPDNNIMLLKIKDLVFFITIE